MQIECRVINLARRTDRLADIGARLDAAEIAWQRTEATDAAAIAQATLAAQLPGASRAYPMAHVERACASSHLASWDAFLATDAQALCVLEDDVQFDAALADFLRDANWVTPAHGVIKLDANSTKPRRSLVSPGAVSLPAQNFTPFRIWSRRLGGGAYLAHRTVIERMATDYRHANAPIDHCLFNPPYSTLFKEPGIHIVEPPLVFHGHDGSDMQATRQAVKSTKGWWRQKLARELVGLGAIPLRLWAMARYGAKFETFNN